MKIEREDLETEVLTDPIDRASSETDFAVREARRIQELRAAAEMPPPAKDKDGEPTGACIDCGDQVEQERIDLGLGRCASCAQERERRDKQRRRTMGGH